jgi:hypothetical protein
VCARPAGFKKLGHNSTELSDNMLIHNTDFCGFSLANGFLCCVDSF